MSVEWPRTHALVIGGAGNLGGAIVATLLERGAQSVSSFDLVPSSVPAVSSHVGSIGDQAALQKAMEGVQVVFHTASVIDIKPIPSPSMHAVNVDGTFNVIVCCKKAGVQRLVYTSSLEVVSGSDECGRPLHANGVDESAPMPVTHVLPYASTKAAAERLVLVAHGAQLHTCAVRPGYIMGARCIGLRLEMVRAKARGGRFITARGPAVISTVHPKNCALLHVLAAEQAHREDVGGRPFFSRDFEANVVEMYLHCLRQPSLGLKVVLLPVLLAYAIAWLLDRFDRLMTLAAACVGAKWSSSEDTIDVAAAGMLYKDIVVTDKAARDVLGYAPLVTREECMREAAEWSRAFWAELSG